MTPPGNGLPPLPKADGVEDRRAFDESFTKWLKAFQKSYEDFVEKNGEDHGELRAWQEEYGPILKELSRVAKVSQILEDLAQRETEHQILSEYGEKWGKRILRIAAVIIALGVIGGAFLGAIKLANLLSAMR